MGPLGHSLAAVAALSSAPVVGLAWVVRPRRREGWAQRLGRAPRSPAGAATPLWVHGASVGEVLAAGRLVDAWCSRGGTALTSTTTRTGQAVARAARPEVPSVLAPLDHPWLVARALSRVRPRALVLVETELWPGWIRAAHERGVPVLVVSGRISDRSFPRYRRFGSLLRATMGRLSAVGARSERDAERFAALGVPPDRIEVTGDLKLEPSREPASLDPALDAMLGEAPLLVAGSTHPGEDAAVLAAFEAALAAGHSLALVVAPRHPKRWDEAARVLAASGRRVVRRSRGADRPLAAGEILLLDSLGELGGLWPRARVAFVGGSLVPVGGHNVLEPVQAGRHVLFGPHTSSARDAAERVLSLGVGTRVRDASDLCDAVRAMLERADDARAVQRVQHALAAHRGATARSLGLLDRVLEAAQ